MLNNRFDSSYYYIILVLNCAQIAPQTQSVAPHTEVEHQTERHDNRRHNVEPTTLEGACVRLDRHYRVGTKVVDDSAVARIAEILDNRLKLFVDSLYLVVGFVLEEHLNPIGCMTQAVVLRVEVMSAA